MCAAAAAGADREEADSRETMNETVEWCITKLYLLNSYY